MLSYSEIHNDNSVVAVVPKGDVNKYAWMIFSSNSIFQEMHQLTLTVTLLLQPLHCIMWVIIYGGHTH